MTENAGREAKPTPESHVVSTFCVEGFGLAMTIVWSKKGLAFMLGEAGYFAIQRL